MNCYFCHNTILEVNINRPFIDVFPTFEIGSCKSCQRINVDNNTISEDGQIIIAHLYCKVREQVYHIRFFLDKNITTFSRITSLGPTSTVNLGEEFLSINYLLPIDINNVTDKLSIYLNFL